MSPVPGKRVYICSISILNANIVTTATKINFRLSLPQTASFIKRNDKSHKASGRLYNTQSGNSISVFLKKQNS